jgi:bifunctional DNA-binding transcriptional regulator/antitoxin component of YhaV-PrlF toxin-antitoxin module
LDVFPACEIVAGQVLIPKRVCAALRLMPGDAVAFGVNHEDMVVTYKAAGRAVIEVGSAKCERVARRKSLDQT